MGDKLNIPPRSPCQELRTTNEGLDADFLLEGALTYPGSTSGIASYRPWAGTDWCGQKLAFNGAVQRAGPLGLEQQTPMCWLRLWNPVLPVHNGYTYLVRLGELPNRNLERIWKAISQSDAY